MSSQRFSWQLVLGELSEFRLRSFLHQRVDRSKQKRNGKSIIFPTPKNMQLRGALHHSQYLSPVSELKGRKKLYSVQTGRAGCFCIALGLLSVSQYV